MQKDDFHEAYWAFTEKRAPRFNRARSGGHAHEPARQDER